MEAIEILQRIIGRLTDEERATTRSYLTTFSQKGKEPRAVALFDMIVAHEKAEGVQLMDGKEVEIALYGAPSTANFTRLLYRLKEKILESLILDINVAREGAYDERSKINMEIRKSLTQVQILQSRGLQDISADILEKIIQQARKYEILEELLLAIRLLINLRRPQDGGKHLNKWLPVYEKYSYMLSAVVRAETQMSRVNAELDFKAGQKAKADWLKTVLDDMVVDYRKTSCAHIGFNYFYLQAQYYQILRDFKNARKALEDNFKLLETHPSIYTKMRVGNVLSNLADNDLYLGQFARCQKTASKALQHFSEGSFNYQQALELIFYAHYYRGDYKSAKNTILQLLPDLFETPDLQYREGKRFYLLACCCFMMGDHNSTIKIANRLVNPIDEDKEGWNIGMRVLTIMALVELQRYDEATSRIAALKTFIDSLNKENITERVLTIATLLRKLSNASFDFKILYQKEKARIETLIGLEWLPKSPEMVMVDQWILAKVFRQPLELTLPEPVFNQRITAQTVAKR